MRALGKWLAAERQRLVDADEKRHEAVMALQAAQRQVAAGAGLEATVLQETVSGQSEAQAALPREERGEDNGKALEKPSFVSLTRRALQRIYDEIVWAEPARIDEHFETHVLERHWHVVVSYLRLNGPHSQGGLAALREGLCASKYKKLGDWWGQTALERCKNTYSLERDNTLPVFKLQDTNDKTCKVLTIMVHGRDVRTTGGDRSEN